MAEPEQFQTAVHRSYGFVTVTNIGFGLLGYLMWGRDVEDLVVSNLAAGAVVIVVKVCLILDLLFTFPVMLAAARETVERMFVLETVPVSWGTQVDNVIGTEGKRNVLRTLLVLLIGVLALSIPNFSAVVNLVSGLALSVVGIVLPPILHTLIFKKALSKAQIGLNVVVTMLGLTACVTTTMQGVQALL
eukprot:GFYU01000899.1.p2 GENE.GFYU01000899.1~~GFYU01000899.1.p2  ORF type:complete len:189 (+),score=47.72 GFYU01000899.1:990-1556(+)